MGEVEEIIRNLSKELDELYHINDLRNGYYLPKESLESAIKIIKCFPKRFRPACEVDKVKGCIVLYWVFRQKFKFGFRVKDKGWKVRIFIEIDNEKPSR